MNPTIFFLSIARIVRETIEKKVNSVSAGANETLASGTEEGGEVGLHPSIVPTVLASIALGTFLIGALFVTLGRCRLTRVIRLLPAAVLGEKLRTLNCECFETSWV